MSKKPKNEIADEPDNEPVIIKTTAPKGPEPIALKLTSAIAIDGKIHRKDQIVHVTETEAKRLLHRGKAVLATVE